MKKEQLEKLGLNDEQINQIFALNGADIQRFKDEAEKNTAELENLRGQLTQRDVDLETLKNAKIDADGFKEQFENLQKKYQEDNLAWAEKLANEQKDRLIEAELAKSGVRDVELLKTIINKDAVELKDGKLSGLTKQISEQKESRPFLFNGDKQANYTPTGGNNAQSGVGTLADEMKKKDFNMTEFLRAKKENGDE